MAFLEFSVVDRVRLAGHGSCSARATKEKITLFNKLSQAKNLGQRFMPMKSESYSLRQATGSGRAVQGGMVCGADIKNMIVISGSCQISAVVGSIDRPGIGVDWSEREKVQCFQMLATIFLEEKTIALFLRGFLLFFQRVTPPPLSTLLPPLSKREGGEGECWGTGRWCGHI